MDMCRDICVLALCDGAHTYAHTHANLPQVSADAINTFNISIVAHGSFYDTTLGGPSDYDLAYRCVTMSHMCDVARVLVNRADRVLLHRLFCSGALGDIRPA